MKKPTDGSNSPNSSDIYKKNKSGIVRITEKEKILKFPKFLIKIK